MHSPQRWGGTSQLQQQPPPPLATVAAPVTPRSPPLTARRPASASPVAVLPAGTGQWSIVPRFGARREVEPPASSAEGRRRLRAAASPTREENEPTSTEPVIAPAAVIAASSSGLSAEALGRLTSLAALHERNLAARAAAQLKADAAQALMRSNLEAVSQACREMGHGLETAEGGFDASLGEYEALLSSRTGVARGLHMQLRRRGPGVSGAAGQEETVDGILDALSAWFTTRTSRFAALDEPALAEREREGADDLAALAMPTGEALLKALPPALQERLLAKLRDATAEQLEGEHRATAQALVNARERIAADAERLAQLQDALEKSAHDRVRIGGARASILSVGAASPEESPHASKRASMVAGGLALAAAAASGSRAAELESLLKKKLWQLGEVEKKRARTVAQLGAVTKAALEKDRKLEQVEAAHKAAQLQYELAALGGGPFIPGSSLLVNPTSAATASTVAGSRDALVAQLLMRSAQQAEEHGALKLFVAHALWEREEHVEETYTREREVQVQRIRDSFERLVDRSTAAVAETGQVERLVPDQIQRLLREAPALASCAPRDAEALMLLMSEPLDTTTTQRSPLDELVHSSLPPELLACAARSCPPPAAAPVAPSQYARKGASSSVSVAGSLGISFPRFLSYSLKHHPLERWVDQNRLARRLRFVFDGLDADRDGLISASELESAYRKEAIGLTKEQMDGVWMAITTPPTPPTPVLPAPLPMPLPTIPAGTSARSRRKGALPTPTPLPPPPPPAPVVEVSDALLSRPLNFANFLSLFSSATLRGIFDGEAPDAASTATAAPNAATRRHAAWLEEHAASLRKETEPPAPAVPPVATPAPSTSPVASSFKGRKPLKALAYSAPSAPAASPSPATGRTDDDLQSATSSALSPELAHDAAPYFTHGTREILLHLLGLEIADMPSAAAAAIDMTALDANVERALRTSSIKGPQPFVERAMEVLLHPLASVRSLLDATEVTNLRAKILARAEADEQAAALQAAASSSHGPTPSPRATMRGKNPKLGLTPPEDQRKSSSRPLSASSKRPGSASSRGRGGGGGGGGGSRPRSASRPLSASRPTAERRRSRARSSAAIVVPPSPTAAVGAAATTPTIEQPSIATPNFASAPPTRRRTLKRSAVLSATQAAAVIASAAAEAAAAVAEAELLQQRVRDQQALVERARASANAEALASLKASLGQHGWSERVTSFERVSSLDPESTAANGPHHSHTLVQGSPRRRPISAASSRSDASPRLSAFGSSGRASLGLTLAIPPPSPSSTALIAAAVAIASARTVTTPTHAVTAAVVAPVPTPVPEEAEPEVDAKQPQDPKPLEYSSDYNEPSEAESISESESEPDRTDLEAEESGPPAHRARRSSLLLRHEGLFAAAGMSPPAWRDQQPSEARSGTNSRTGSLRATWQSQSVGIETEAARTSQTEETGLVSRLARDLVPAASNDADLRRVSSRHASVTKATEVALTPSSQQRTGGRAWRTARRSNPEMDVAASSAAALQPRQAQPAAGEIKTSRSSSITVSSREIAVQTDEASESPPPSTQPLLSHGGRFVPSVTPLALFQPSPSPSVVDASEEKEPSSPFVFPSGDHDFGSLSIRPSGVSDAHALYLQQLMAAAAPYTPTARLASHPALAHPSHPGDSSSTLLGAAGAGLLASADGPPFGSSHDTRTLLQLLETERARVAQLERALRLYANSGSGQAQATSQQRHLHTSLGGSLTARHRGDAPRALSSRRPPSAFTASPSSSYAFPTPVSYTELISRRGDGLRGVLLTGQTLALPKPLAVPLQPQRPTSAFPRA